MPKYARKDSPSSRDERRAMITLSQEEATLARTIAEEEAIPYAVLLRSWIVQELRRRAAVRQQQGSQETVGPSLQKCR